jgi:hypothetical protein
MGIERNHRFLFWPNARFHDEITAIVLTNPTTAAGYPRSGFSAKRCYAWMYLSRQCSASSWLRAASVSSRFRQACSGRPFLDLAGQLLYGY